MIIQIRGTSGSGKTTAMRRIMERLGEWKPVYRLGRKKPLYYVSRSNPIAVLGHYEDSACGGCDTIGSARKVFELIREVQSKEGESISILAEGLLLSEDVKWSSQLEDLRVIFLITPLDECLRRIKKRREQVGNNDPLNPLNTSKRTVIIERARTKLLNLRVECRRSSVEQSTEVMVKWLSSPLMSMNLVVNL